MPPPAEPIRGRVVSYKVLAAFVLGGIGISYLLVPSQGELRRRMQRDQLEKQIMPFLSSGEFSDTRALDEAFAAMSHERIMMLAQLARLTPREQLQRIFDRRWKLQYDPVTHAFVMAAIRFVDVLPPDEALKLIEPMSAQMPDAARHEVFQLLARNAMGLNQQKLAYELQLKASRCASATFTTMQDLVRASRWTSHQAVAAEEFRRWLKRNAANLSPAEREELDQTHFSLALEANLPGEAFDLCLAELKALPTMNAASPELMERAYKTSVMAERSKEMLPWIEVHIAAMPEAALSWQDLVAEAKKNGPAETAYAKWIRRAAEIADWHLLPEKAYAHNKRLIAMGHIAALDRFLPLSNYLGLGDETAELLQQVEPPPGRESIQIFTARLIASNGKPAQARGMFEEWVKMNPADKAAAYELACLLEGIADTATATRAFENFLRIFSRDPAAVKKLAALRVRAGQHEAALSELDSLANAEFDPDTLENYMMLAESLDRASSLERSLRMMLAAPKEAKPELFLRLAEVSQQLNGDEGRLAVLREGITHLPQSPSLRVELAAALIEEERFEEAAAEALHPVVRGRLDAITLALAASIHVNRAAEALKAAGDDFEKRYELTTGVRLDLAVACLQAGQAERGERLFAAALAAKASAARLAEARLLAGHFSLAERLARQNLAEVSEPESADWILLGDTLSRQERQAEANDCYSKALAITGGLLIRKARPAPVASTRAPAETSNQP